MSLYTPSSEETLRTRKLLEEWTGEGLLTKAQYHRLEQETISELRTTNIFLRLALFLFTLVSVVATVALFFMAFLSQSSEQTSGMVFLIFAVVCYAAAEVSVSQARLYRYGIEEALVVCSVGLFCLGLQSAFFSGNSSAQNPHIVQFLPLVAGAVFSLWIWHRFGLWYAFPAAMIFALFLPGYWTSSRSAQHVIVATLYAVALIYVAARRSRQGFDSLEDAYSLVEAFLWLGIYLAINLKISALNVPSHWWDGARATSDFARPFYWTTWVLTWCLPPVVIARGIRQKNRSVIAVGAVLAVLTFVSNKPYLGWQRHTWDPMLLGICLTGVALLIRHWLARGPGGIRHGFTAARLSGRDKRWMNAGSAFVGLVSPQSFTPTPQPNSPDVRFGGTSEGGGASGEF